MESRASMDIDFDLLAVQYGDIVIRKGIHVGNLDILFDDRDGFFGSLELRKLDVGVGIAIFERV